MGNIWFTGPTTSDVPAATKRSHAAAAAGARQVGEREVRGVGLGRADELPGLALVAPVRLARALAGEKLGQRHGLVALPAAAGRAEVGDTGGRREPGAGQHDDAAGLAPRVGKRTRRAHSLSPDPCGRTHASCPPPSQTIVAPHPPRSGGASAKRSTSGLAASTSWTRRRCTPRPRPWTKRTSRKPASA